MPSDRKLVLSSALIYIYREMVACRYMHATTKQNSLDYNRFKLEKLNVTLATSNFLSFRKDNPTT